MWRSPQDKRTRAPSGLDRAADGRRFVATAAMSFALAVGFLDVSPAAAQADPFCASEAGALSMCARSCASLCVTDDDFYEVNRVQCDQVLDQPRDERVDSAECPIGRAGGTSGGQGGEGEGEGGGEQITSTADELCERPVDDGSSPIEWEVPPPTCMPTLAYLECRFTAVASDAEALIQMFQGVVDGPTANVSPDDICTISRTELEAQFVLVREQTPAGQSVREQFLRETECLTEVREWINNLPVPNVDGGGDPFRQAMQARIESTISPMLARSAELQRLLNRVGAAQENIRRIHQFHRFACPASD